RGKAAIQVVLVGDGLRQGVGHAGQVVADIVGIPRVVAGRVGDVGEVVVRIVGILGGAAGRIDDRREAPADVLLLLGPVAGRGVVGVRQVAGRVVVQEGIPAVGGVDLGLAIHRVVGHGSRVTQRVGLERQVAVLIVGVFRQAALGVGLRLDPVHLVVGELGL